METWEQSARRAAGYCSAQRWATPTARAGSSFGPPVTSGSRSCSYRFIARPFAWSRTHARPTRSTSRRAGSTPGGASCRSARCGAGRWSSGGTRPSEGMEKKRPSRFRYTRRYGIIAAVVLAALINLLYPRDANVVPLGYGTFRQILQAPGAQFQDLRVGTASVRGQVTFNDRISGADGDSASREPIPFRVTRQGVGEDPGLIALLNAHAPGFQAEGEKSVGAVLMEVLTYLLLLTLLVLGGVYVARKWLGLGGPLGFGRARHRLYAADDRRMTFKDVAGIEEAKAELKEVVDFLQDSDKYKNLGGRIPKGVLLVGPPGTGKTLLAKSVAGEAGVPFFSISGSDFVEMFVGVGASRVRDLFEQAKQAAPCIVFMDEIDAVGRHRGAGLGGGHDEREQTLNQLLVEMDGFELKDNIILIAATNRPDILDPALLRPGRFDRQIVVDRPDRIGRRKILEVHAKGKPIASEIDLDTLAAGTPGFTGADLANLVNEAALLAARRGKKTIEQEELEEGIMRVIAGPEKKTRLLGEEERQVTAYHEIGHALVGHYLDQDTDVHKISVISRGQALGYTIWLPREDR